MAESASPGAETRYKIGDVCRIADVQPYVLRYWESEFPVLAPDRSQTGPRTYSERELRYVEQIKRLLYDEGYTIAGAKKRLDGDAAAAGQPAPAPAPKVENGAAKHTAADTNPAIMAIPPVAPAPGKAERADRSGVTTRAARLPKPAPAAAAAGPADASKRHTVEVPVPVAVPPPPAPKSARISDERVARAVAELKEVLALLSRAAP